MEHAAQQMTTASWLVLIPLFPLLGFLFNGLGWLFLKERFPRPVVNWAACLVVWASFAVSVYGFYTLLGLEPEQRLITQDVFTWIQSGALRIAFGLMLDPLSCVMCLVVTGVGGLIHIYSTGYMGHDPGYARYFAYLNLFTFAMLVLVSAGNIALMFVGWEGVGLCSYLLIGFWYEDNEKASAGKKAFIVNRVGDFGFLIGIFTIVLLMHTVDFTAMREWVAANSEAVANRKILGISIVTFICLALFVGATGKSAQIPLYVWLPDAMAGPTPVSALIHAATMVTAGVYMIGRMSFLYVHSPTALSVVAVVGVVTALYSATIGFTQNDIKKVLAYSTVSQLGYMFTAMGVAAFSAGIFHLTTHAFFKALLFLCSGSVIHGLSGEQDMRKMGGLSSKMPITFATMAVGWLAISGFPFLSGFISKDEILWQAFSSPHGHVAIWLVGFVAAICTAIYMTRLIMLTFLTPSRMEHEVEHHVHESPASMTIPLIILAVLSIFGGVLNWPKLFRGSAAFERWLEPAFAHVAHEGAHHSHAVELGLMALSTGLALVAIVVVYFLYKKRGDLVDKITTAAGPLYRASYNKYWVDEIYDVTIVEPTKQVSTFFLWKFVDVKIVDGIANGLAGLTKAVGQVVRRIQTGEVQTYAAAMVLGITAVFGYLLYVAFR